MNVIFCQEEKVLFELRNTKKSLGTKTIEKNFYAT